MARTKMTIGSTTEDLNDARLPAALGTAKQVLKMNSTADSIIWANQDPGVIVSDTEPAGAEVGTVWIDTSVSGETPQDINTAISTHNASTLAHNDIRTALNGKASSVHTHDDRYYTETEIDTLLSNKADTSDIPEALSELVDDLGSNPTHTHSQYLTSHQDITGKEDVGYVTIGGTKYSIEVTDVDPGTGTAGKIIIVTG